MKTRRHLSVRLSLFAFALLAAQLSMHAQSANSIVASTNLRSADKGNDSMLAQRAVACLKRLKADVFVYRSDGEFESDGNLARVPLETFTDKLNQATAEIESILPQLSDVKLRNYLSNSLYSYRDGAFWWAKLDQKKVVTIGSLRVDGYRTITPADCLLQSTAAYTVVVHWRQANKYLLRAERLIVGMNTSVSEHRRFIASDRKFH